MDDETRGTTEELFAQRTGDPDVDDAHVVACLRASVTGLELLVDSHTTASILAGQDPLVSVRLGWIRSLKILFGRAQESLTRRLEQTVGEGGQPGVEAVRNQVLGYLAGCRGEPVLASEVALGLGVTEPLVIGSLVYWVDRGRVSREAQPGEWVVYRLVR